MSTSWALWNTATGLFRPGALTCSRAQLPANTPAGWAAMEGRFDPLSQRVDLATGQVVDYQPPAPPDDALRTWAWDDATRRWVPTPTLEADKQRALADVQAHIDGIEAGQGRSVREVLLALSAGQAVPPEAAAALADIEAAIEPARAAADVISAATTSEELAAATAAAVSVISPPVDVLPPTD